MQILPEGWRWAQVAELGEIQLGRQRAPRYHTGSNMRPYLRVANVFEDRIDTSDVKTMHFEPEEFERYRLYPGDILLNEGQTPELLGRPAMYQGNPPNVAFTNSLIRFRAGPYVDPGWALFVFRRHMHFGRFARESRITTNIAHLSAARFKAVEFPVPPLDQQWRIVEILEDHLSRINAGKDGVMRSIRRLQLLESVELQALLAGESCGATKLANLIQRVEAGRSYGGSAPAASLDEWGIIKVSAMTWGVFRPDENKAVSPDKVDARFEIQPGDLLLSRANTSAYVGASVLVDKTRPRLLLSDKSLRLVPVHGVDVRWLAAALAAPGARQQISAKATGTKDSMRNISQKELLSVVLPLASADQQQRVVVRRQEITSRSRRAEKQFDDALRRAENLRRAMFSAAFSGRLTGRSTDTEVIEEMSSV